MLCCGLCGNMSKRDYKVATTDGIELEPLGSDKENLTNGCKNGKHAPPKCVNCISLCATYLSMMYVY